MFNLLLMSLLALLFVWVCALLLLHLCVRGWCWCCFGPPLLLLFVVLLLLLRIHTLLSWLVGVMLSIRTIILCPSTLGF